MTRILGRPEGYAASVPLKLVIREDIPYRSPGVGLSPGSYEATWDGAKWMSGAAELKALMPRFDQSDAQAEGSVAVFISRSDTGQVVARHVYGPGEWVETAPGEFDLRKRVGTRRWLETQAMVDVMEGAKGAAKSVTDATLDLTNEKATLTAVIDQQVERVDSGLADITQTTDEMRSVAATYSIGREPHAGDPAGTYRWVNSDGDVIDTSWSGTAKTGETVALATAQGYTARVPDLAALAVYAGPAQTVVVDDPRAGDVYTLDTTSDPAISPHLFAPGANNRRWRGSMIGDRFDARRLGAKPDWLRNQFTGQNNWQPITDALDVCHRIGANLLLPSEGYGYYAVGGTLKIPHGVSIYGSGYTVLESDQSDWPGTKLFRLGNEPLLDMSGTPGTDGTSAGARKIRSGLFNLLLHGNNQAATLVNANYTSGLIFDNVTWFSGAGTLLSAVGMWDTHFLYPVFYYGGSATAPVVDFGAGHDTNHIHMFAPRWEQNSGTGFTWGKGNNKLTIIAGKCDNHAGATGRAFEMLESFYDHVEMEIINTGSVQDGQGNAYVALDELIYLYAVNGLTGHLKFDKQPGRPLKHFLTLDNCGRIDLIADFRRAELLSDMYCIEHRNGNNPGVNVTGGIIKNTGNKLYSNVSTPTKLGEGALLNGPMRLQYSGQNPWDVTPTDDGSLKIYRNGAETLAISAGGEIVPRGWVTAGSGAALRAASNSDGLRVQSADGSWWRLQIDNSGAVSTVKV